MRAILAGPDEERLVAEAYMAFGAAGHDVVGVAASREELASLAEAAEPGAAVVVEANLYPSAEEAARALGSLPARVVVILPEAWVGEEGTFAAIGAVYPAPVAWHRLAQDLKQAGVGRAQQAAPVPGPSTREPALDGEAPGPDEESGPEEVGAGRRTMPAPSHSPRRPGPGRTGRVVAFWSGPAGGTGRTTLALALAAHAAEQGVDTTLVALSEPALSAYLGLPRVPNVEGVLEGGPLEEATQRIGWKSNGGRVTLNVILGPKRPQDGVADRDQVADLLEAVAGACELAVFDLPALTPGGSPWALEPIVHAGDVVLVAVPFTVGVTAVVEALVALKGLTDANLHLVLNRRAPGGIAQAGFVEGVESLWGSCPPVAAEVGFLPGMAEALERAALPEDEELDSAMRALGAAAAGLPDVREEEGGTREPRHPETRDERPRRKGRGLGRLITVEVTE